MDGVLHNREASLRSGATKVRWSMVSWDPPSLGISKFNMDGAAKCKPGPVEIGGVLYNSEGIILALFSKHVGCM